MKAKNIGPFLGINTRLSDSALSTKDGDYVRDAVNVFTDSSGNFIRRKPLELVQAITAPHSLHKSVSGNFYLVRDSVLYRVTLPGYSETFVKALTSNSRMSYDDYAGATYFSNGVDSGRVEGATAYPIALPTPDTPAVTQVAGTMPSGTYQVAVAYLNAVTGERGGVSASNNPAVTGPGGLRVSLPPVTAGATHVEVYVSTQNGSIPMLATTVAVGTATVDISAPGTGMEATQRYEAPLPAGELFMFNGALCSFSGNAVYEGLPFRPGYYLPAEGRIPFPAEVTNAVPAQNGVYVVADKTYWVSGTRMSKSEMVVDVLPYGGVRGTSFQHPNGKDVGWFGDKGFVIGNTGGEVSAPMSEVVSIAGLPARATTVVFDTPDLRAAVSWGWCLNLITGALTRFDGYDFTSSSDGFGTKSDGVYSLSGTGDLDWEVSLGKLNFGKEPKKFLPAIYVGVESSGTVSATVKTPEHDFTYQSRNFGETLAVHRIDPGKGLRANWFDLKIHGKTDMKMASISFANNASQRRI